MAIRLFALYKGVGRSFRMYWTLYGGIGALVQSPYLHFAIFLSFVCFPIWGYKEPPAAWFDICISVVPNVLGFTLGGYAILLAFGDEKFREVLSGSTKDEPSPFISVNASFLHFIIAQISSLFFAFIALAYGQKTGLIAWFGFTLFLYALSTAVAAGMAILRVANWFDIFNSEN
jgi:hypothetical protein